MSDPSAIGPVEKFPMNCLYLDASRDRMSAALESGGSWFARESIDGRHDQGLVGNDAIHLP